MTLCVYRSEYCFIPRSIASLLATSVTVCGPCHPLVGVSLQVLLPVCIVHVVVFGPLIMLFFCKVSTNVGSIVRWLLAMCVTVWAWSSAYCVRLPLAPIGFVRLLLTTSVVAIRCSHYCHDRRWFRLLRSYCCRSRAAVVAVAAVSVNVGEDGL